MSWRQMGWIILGSCLILSGFGCASLGSTVKGPEGERHAMVGGASYYADHFHGRTTASGEVYDRGAMTAAHKTLPFGTLVRVTGVDTRKSVVVRINDRGPFIRGRVIDLSYAAARDMDMIRDGVVDVELEILQW